MSDALGLLVAVGIATTAVPLGALLIGWSIKRDDRGRR